MSLNGILTNISLYYKIQNSWKDIDTLGDVPPPVYGPGFTEFDFDGTLYFAIGCSDKIEASGGNNSYLFDSSNYISTLLPNVSKVKPDGSVHNLPSVKLNTKYF